MTQEELKSLLIYKPETGDFFWINSSKNGWNGKKAGTVNDKGYSVIEYKNKAYRSHRVAFLYMLGFVPKCGVDHIDGNTSNNKWSNLRECNQSQNGANSKKPKNNTSEYKGVSFTKDKKVRPWRAAIRVNKKAIHGGYFETKNEAAVAYNAMAIKYYGEFAKLNNID